jgi:hypothetical protein
MVHLELLHNFCLSTSSTLTVNPALRTLWQTNVPQVGFTCDYVMHSILSLSALHLAHFKPEQRGFFLAQAMELHHLALAKGSVMLSHVTSDNHTELYLFSVLACFFALARPRDKDSFLLEPGTGLAEWLFMFRGTRIVIESSNPAKLHSGPLGPMFVMGARRAQSQTSSSEQLDHPLRDLQTLFAETTTDVDMLSTYNFCVEELLKSFNVIYDQDPKLYDVTDVFIWLYRVPNEYLGFLHERKPEALSIFAYFCVLLKQLNARWWLEGWSIHLISQIYAALDEEHRLWISWPIRELGWIPSGSSGSFTGHK